MPPAEGDQKALVLKPPADVDIVAGLEKMRIKPVDRLESLTAECHVATGDVFGNLVAYQHVGRLSGCGRDASGQPAIVGSQVGPPDRRSPARVNWWTKWINQSGSAMQSESV